MRLSDDRIKAIKAATSQLVLKAGGAEAAAMVCRASAPVLYEYMSINRLDRVIAADVAMQLEAFVGEPVVTAAMARLHGYTVTRPDAVAVPQVGAAVGTVAAQAGALASLLLAAQADGTLDDGEMAALRGVAERVRDAANATLAGLSPAAPALRAVG